jgi:hypothetical protein
MLNNKQLVAWCEAALAAGAKYWYGTCWYEADDDLLKRKAKQYPSHYTASRMSTYRKHIAANKMVCDCVGLIKGFFWTSNGATANKYKANNCPDTSANGMINLCDETWAIDKMPDEPGLVVWMSGHIGVYVGNGEVIEARGYKYGVVKTKLKGRGWKKAGRLPEAMLAFDDDHEAKPAATPLLKKGAIGEAVEHMQTILIKWNPKALPIYGADGEFGAETLKWVKSFQRSFGLAQDGIVGPLTWGALLDVEATSDE